MLICDSGKKTLQDLPTGTVYKVKGYDNIYLVTERNESMFNVTMGRQCLMNDADRKCTITIYPNACLDLGGSDVVKDRGLEEKPDHDYYVFTITCKNGEEKFYFQIDELSYAFKDEPNENDGSSIEKAITPIIDPTLTGFEKNSAAVRSEYVYLNANACADNSGIMSTPDNRNSISQALVEADGEHYDQMTVNCNNGEDEVYFFVTYFDELDLS